MVRVRDSIVQHQKFHAIFAVAAAASHEQQYVVHTTVSTSSTYTNLRVQKHFAGVFCIK